MRKTLVLLLFALVCSGWSISLKEAKSLESTQAHSDQFRAYNMYKSLYLRALIDDNSLLTSQALQGIVRTGKALHIEVQKYEQELATVQSSRSHTKPSKHATTWKRGNHRTVTLKKQIRLTRVGWNHGKILLRFDNALPKGSIQYFTLKATKKYKYRYVFDIHNVTLQKQEKLIHKQIRSIRLAQFKPDVMRLVLENDTPLNVTYHNDSNQLTIGLGIKDTFTSTVIAKQKKYQKIIVIDPGHGGKDGGAVGYKHRLEKKVVLSLSKKLRDELKKRGYKVYMTRSTDRFVELRSRTKFANKKGAHLFISIHANSVPKRNRKKAHGIEVYFLSPARTERANNVAATENSKDVNTMNFYAKMSFLNFLNREKILASNRLAIDLQQNTIAQLQKHYKVKDAGVKEGPFWVLVGAQMPAVLVEVGFISHPTESSKLINQRYQKEFAIGLAKGVERYFEKNR